MISGGLFNTTFTGRGVICHHRARHPVVLQRRRADVRRHAGCGLWSTALQSGVRRTAKRGRVIGRGSGEAYQLALTGQGFVVVQASEGHVVETHSH